MENLWKGGINMTQLNCSICGRVCDDEITQICPECGECVCEECGTLYDGYCEECYSTVVDNYE